MVICLNSKAEILPGEVTATDFTGQGNAETLKPESENWDFTAGARFVPNRSTSPSLIALKLSEPCWPCPALRVETIRAPQGPAGKTILKHALKTAIGLPQKAQKAQKLLTTDGHR